MLKVRAHTCYLGNTGFAAHSRYFFRELSKYVDLRIRNYTWDPNPDYINEVDLSILDQITLYDNNGNENTHPISNPFPNLEWKNSNTDFNQDIDIVLMEQGHVYFYQEYNAKLKIAYTVWESTLLEEDFFKKLLEFDYLWVVSKWHKDCIVKQGYPEDRVFVVNEGVNSEMFEDCPKLEHLPELHDNSFNFLFFGRWDYRKFVPEIIDSFIKAFPNDEKVNLILSADNLYSIDGFKTTEERLEHFGFNDKRIKVKHFLRRKDYISYLKNAQVMITCARSEGWNIPLIESMAAGTPVIYSNWGAQLEFAEGLGIPVSIKEELRADLGDHFGWSGKVPGFYAEPDKEDLILKIRESYDNWIEKKEKALKDAEVIKQKFNWEVVGKSGYDVLKNLWSKPKPDNYRINVHFINGPFVEVLGNTSSRFKVEFIDLDTKQVIHTGNVKCNMWIRPSRKYYTNWFVRVSNLSNGEIFEHKIDLNGKRVLISIDSSALGDSLAWFPPIENFAIKHKCKLIVSTFKNDLFKDQYPDIEFIKPGEVVNNIYASYNIGWFYDKDGKVDLNKNPKNFRMEPLQKAANDILGLEYIPKKPRLTNDLGERPIKEPYVCFAIHSTAQAKYWNNPTGWQELTDYFKKRGKKVVILSREGNGYMNNFYPEGVMEVEGEKTLENAMRYLKYCDIFVGVSSGLSWLSWALNKPTVIISGFSWPITEVEDSNIIRVFKPGGCTGCSNRHKLDPGDWNWCPDKKNTPNQFECSKLIKASDVIYEIENHKYHVENKTKSISEIIQESYNLGMVQNYTEIYDASVFVKNLAIKSFIEIGTDQGGTFAIWSKLSEADDIRISVDLPHGEFGKDNYDLEKRDEYLKSLGSFVYPIHGDSHREYIKNTVSSLLGDKKVDFLFIDGDHRYEGVKLDYLMYSEFVKPGGWIGFHDIKDTEFHRSANCRVDILWDELEGDKISFIDKNSNFGGIGFIRKN